MGRFAIRIWLAMLRNGFGKPVVATTQTQVKGDLDVVLDCSGDLRGAGWPGRADDSAIAHASATPAPSAAAARMPGDHIPVGGTGAGGDGAATRSAINGATRLGLLLQVDGTPGAAPRGMAGIGIVVRDQAGSVVAWQCARAPALTNNEAEYQAIIAGLELMLARYPGAAVRCLTDSQIAVEQIAGRSAVRASALQPLHQRARALASQFDDLTFVAIPRELNRLADALAWEALTGRRGIALRDA
jgi:ribonuclease HI